MRKLAAAFPFPALLAVEIGTGADGGPVPLSVEDAFARERGLAWTASLLAAAADATARGGFP